MTTTSTAPSLAPAAPVAPLARLERALALAVGAQAHLTLPASSAAARAHDERCPWCSGRAPGDTPSVDRELRSRIGPVVMAATPALAMLGGHASAPIAARDGRVLGTICISDDAVRDWTATELAMLEQFAALAAETIALAESRSVDPAEAQQFEEAIRESEARFRNAFDHAPIGMALVAPDGRWLRVNRAVCELTGYSERELLDGSFQDITHPDDLDADLEFVRRMLAGELRTYAMEKRYLHKCGDVVWALLSVSLVRDARGEPLTFLSQIQDITAQKAAEAALRESERRFREILGTVRSVAVCLDTQGCITYANDALLSLTGWTRDEVLGQSWFEMFLPRGSAAATAMRDAVADGTLPSHVESEILAVSGERRLMSWDNTVLRDARGAVVGAASLGRDVTEQRESEAASARLSAILDAMPDAVAIATPAGEMPYVNGAARRLLGLASTNDRAPSAASLAVLPHHELGALGPALVRDPERGGPMRQALREGVWMGETTCETIGGSAVPVHQTLLTHRGADGQVEYFSTIVRDITERKRIEEELRALSLVDDLTGLFNRRGFLAMAAQQLRLAEHSPRTSLLFYLDLNHFKAVNDTWGHAVGDLALERTAAILRVTFRETDVLARIGGDEFVALALNCGDTGDYIVSRLEAQIAEENARLAGEGHGFALSMAEGRARFDPAAPRSLEGLMAAADLALYEAKRNRH